MSMLDAVETLAERRRIRNRNNPGFAMRGGDAITSPAEEAARRLAQREADEALVAAELAQADEHARNVAAIRAVAPDKLREAEEAYYTARRPVECGLLGARYSVPEGAEVIDVPGLLDALEALVPARRAYDEAFSICDRYDCLPEDVVRIEPLSIGRYLHRLINLAAAA